VVAAIEAAGGDAVAVRADVSRRGEVDAMLSSIDARFDRLDVDTWRRTLAVNLDGAFCLRAAIPRLRAAGGGRIVNISSGAARTGGTIGAHYAASKAGMLALTARAARELAADNIAVRSPTAAARSRPTCSRRWRVMTPHARVCARSFRWVASVSPKKSRPSSAFCARVPRRT
jgi:3-oxoacyl-[acyl-carrier protein] reductase